MATPKPAPAPPKPIKPITAVGPGTGSGNTSSNDTITSSVSYDLQTQASGAHGLILTGSGNLLGKGNNQATNYLSAAQNSGNTTLVAGAGNASSKSTLIGGSGSNSLYGATSAGTLNLIGGAGNNTIVAGSGAATLSGGAKSNYLQAGSGAQSLWGGSNNGSSLYGNTLKGGTGKDTLRSGTGYNTLISGSSAGTSTTISTAAASGVTAIRVASIFGLAVGQQIAGNGIAEGTTITAISGTQLTLSTKTISAVAAGTRINNVGNILIGGGISSYLQASNLGNDSLAAVSGAATLVGGTGKDTLLSGSGTNSLVSGSAAGLPGYGNLLNANLGTSNTLVAGLGSDTLIGGSKQNLLLVTQANQSAFASDSISLSTLSSAQNSLGYSASTPGAITDALFAGMDASQVRNLGTVVDLSGSGNSGNSIILGSHAQNVGVHTVVGGPGSDTLSVAAFTTNSVLLDGSQSVSRVSLIGGGTGNDTFLGSKGGYDTMLGASGNDSFVIQASALAGSSFGVINGNGGIDTLQLSAAAILAGTNFNGVSNIEVLQLGSGNNSVGSLQGSGIQKIIGNTGSDTISANVYGSVKTATQSGSRSVTLNVSPGTDPMMGFSPGMVVTGNGIPAGTIIAPNGVTTGISSLSTQAARGATILALTGIPSSYAIGQAITGAGIATGTTIKAIFGSTVTLSTGLTSALNAGSQVTNNTVTITLSSPTSSLISQGGAITGWINGATLDGSAALGLAPTDAEKNKASKAFADKASSITAANFGLPGELYRDTLAISTLKNDPSTYIHRKGDYLVSYGQSNLLIGGQGNGLPDINIGGGSYTDNSSVGVKGSLFLRGFPYTQHQVVDNTLVSGAFASNTLIGGSGANLYLINNQPDAAAALPTIQNPTSLQSASTIQFTGNGLRLDDLALSSVGAHAAQKIITANGNNLIAIGQNAAQIGIQTIIGGIGSDTFTTPGDYAPSVYFDASRNGGISSLSSGAGNDTLLGGTGNSTLIGGDGNNSLIGGNGYNLIKSGVGNSILDSGYGISTLQADGGTNHFVVRNRYTRILNPDQSNPSTGTIPEVGIVDTYVNFDPIQGSPVSQFSPYYPDNSPSITKSPSFASSDLSSFYNLQYFNLLGSANYGVGNALDNTITAAAANALILGMGGNNTIVASGVGSSLYGNSNANYASPDLYAYAPIDTRDQAFVDGVMGVAGNNSLVANGAGSYLDAGSGYDSGHFDGSGSNTLIGTGGNDTVLQSHQADVVSLTGSSNTVITSVDLYQAPDNVSNLIVNVTPQFANSGEVSFAGQRMTASYAAVAGATGGYTDTNSLHAGNAPTITVRNSAKLQVAYGTSDGTVYGSDNVTDSNLPLTVGTFTPDPKNPGKEAVTLSWTTPLTPDGKTVGQTMGYLVNYQLVASTAQTTLSSLASSGDSILTVADITGITLGEKISGSGIVDGTSIIAIDTLTNQLTLSDAITQDISSGGQVTAFVTTPYLTYLSGTSQDLTGTSVNPRLLVDNLPTSFTDPYTGTTYNSSNATISYNFKVTAQETVLPAYTDENGSLIAKPVSLIGGQGNDVIYGGLLENVASGISNTRPVLTNNPIDPLDPGTIATPAPWALTASNSGLFPVYESGGLGGDDLLIAPFIGYTTDTLVADGYDPSTGFNTLSGQDFTAYEYLNGVPTGVTYSGLNTLEGGQGSDTFIVTNGGATIDTTNGVVTTGAYDHIIKYGNETPAGKHNLVVSGVRYLSLSDTVVDQGKFIDQAEVAFGNQFLAGNRLDNTLGGYGAQSTLMGGGGRDTIYNVAGFAAGDVLIGGTAYGFDSIAGALADYAAGQTNSIYRDTDPVPVGVNGPGTADNSQYWIVNGGYDPLRNSDTLVTNEESGANVTLDGGAGNDSMVGSVGNDFFIVSNGSTDFGNVLSKDVVVGNGGNDTVMFTGSDTFWSGLPGATATGLSYRLSIQGDGGGGQSISNLILQAGDPIARYAYGNYTSNGNAHAGNPFGVTELGSNYIVGNNTVAGYTGSGNNVLDGGGVGGGANGSGVGVDTLIGNGGADTFQVAGYYTGSAKDTLASGIVSSVSFAGGIETDVLSNIVPSTGQSSYATDGDWALIDVSVNQAQGDAYIINVGLGSGTFLLGAAPSSFGPGNLQGGGWNPNDFGIYKYTPGGHSAPNLVAEVIGANLPQPGTSAYYTILATVNGTTTTLTVDGGTGVNHLGAATETIAHTYTGAGVNSDWYKPTSPAVPGSAGPPPTPPAPPIYGGDISASALVTQANTDVHNFLGMGAMYNLLGSGFASHVI